MVTHTPTEILAETTQYRIKTLLTAREKERFQLNPNEERKEKKKKNQCLAGVSFAVNQ